MEKGFFKLFSPENSSKRLKIPTAFTDYKNGKLPKKISLRDRFGNMWPIRVAKTGRDFYFQHGWEKFIEENTVEFGDFFIFDYDGNGVFDFKLLGKTGCEKKGAGGLKLSVNEGEEEEMNVQHQKSLEPKRKNWASYSSSSSSSSDKDEDYMVEEEDEDEENVRAITMYKKKEPRSKGRCMEKEAEEEEEEIEKAPRLKRRHVEEEEEADKNERSGTFKKKASSSKVTFLDVAVYKRGTARKVRDIPDQYGADIFKSGRATQPTNPYFVVTLRAKRRDQLYIPIDVVRDYNLELPSSMTIRDSAGREFKTKLKNWKDGRIWLIGGWRSLCRWNLVEKDDRCICEFVRGKGKKGLYLQVQVLHEVSVSNSNNKYKK